MNKNPLIRPLFAAILVAVLQTAFLGYMIESRASILRNGVDVVLKTVPVDPRDLLRGDYVILAYDISTIPGDRVKGKRPDTSGTHELWVRLEKTSTGYWDAAEASFEPLAPQAGSVIAHGKIGYQALASLFDAAGALLNPEDAAAPLTNIEYGIERYYVPEGEGKVLEEARNASALSVTARVDDAGTMQIRLIAIDGKPLYEEPLY